MHFSEEVVLTIVILIEVAFDDTDLGPIRDYHGLVILYAQAFEIFLDALLVEEVANIQHLVFDLCVRIILRYFTFVPLKL